MNSKVLNALKSLKPKEAFYNSVKAFSKGKI